MAKTKWPKLPRFFVPLFHCANVYLCRSKGEWQQAEKALGVSLADVSMFNGMCRQFVNDETGENLYLVVEFAPHPLRAKRNGEVYTRKLRGVVTVEFRQCNGVHHGHS